MSIENAEIPDKWPGNPGYINRFQTDEQIRLIEQHGAQEALRLRQESEDRWTIQLGMVRIVDRKRES